MRPGDGVQKGERYVLLVVAQPGQCRRPQCWEGVGLGNQLGEVLDAGRPAHGDGMVGEIMRGPIRGQNVALIAYDGHQGPVKVGLLEEAIPLHKEHRGLPGHRLACQALLADDLVEIGPEVGKHMPGVLTHHGRVFRTDQGRVGLVVDDGASRAPVGYARV